MPAPNGAGQEHSRVALLALALVACLGACATGRSVTITGGEIRNLTAAPIFEVEVNHEPTGRAACVSQILPNQAFQLGFPSRDLRARAAVLSWIGAQGAPRSARVEIPPCPVELLDGPVWMVYSIHGDGHVEFAFARAAR